MGADWTSTSWGDVAELRYGKGLKGYRQHLEGYRVYGTNGPVGYTPEPLASGPVVVVGRKGAYRGVHYSRDDCWVIDTAFFLAADASTVDQRWAYYALRNVDINAMDSGSAIPSLSRRDFDALHLELPPLDEQRAIAEVLGSLDDRIEWCVDHADLVLAAQVALLDTAAWHGVQRLGDVADISKGKSYKGGLLADEGFPLVNLGMFGRQASVRWENLKFYAEALGPKHSVRGEDVVVCATDMTQDRVVLGRGFVIPAGFEGGLTHHLMRVRVRADADVDPLVIALTLSSDRVRPSLAAKANGTTVLALPTDVVENQEVPVLDQQTLDRLSVLEAQIHRLRDEEAALAALRDSLLPRLVSGELRLPDVDALLAGVV